MTTKLIGEKVQRVEDERLLRGQGRYVDDLLADPHAGTLTRPCCAARTRTRGSSTSTSTRSSTSRACSRSTPTTT